MSRRLVAALAALATLGAVVVAGGSLRTSSASYTSSSHNTATVRAAADWTPPTVSLRTLSPTVFGTVTVTADAADPETGIASLAVQQRAAGTAGWATLCTPATAPYSCSWDTTKAADGGHELRAVATDRTGLSTTSAVTATAVSNAVAVALADPGDSVRGTVPLTASLSGAAAGSGTWSLRFEQAVAGSSTWRTICTDSTAPYSCSWVTTTLANQEYDLRVVAVSGATVRHSEVLPDVFVDNTAPTVSMLNPGSPLRGTVTFAVDADDEDSGIDQVVIQYAVAGSTSYKELCTITDEPYSCAYRTPQLPDGTYSFRAVATDQAGNTSTSAAATNRVVDNTVATVSVDDPGAYLRGRVTVTASASSTAGVASVRLQRAVTGSGTWTDLCTDTAAPYGCTWDTGLVADGSYDLRAVMTDSAGRVTTSAVLAGRRVDNSPLRAVDVQTANGGASAGRLDTGDTVTFTYSERLNLGSMVTGWNGARTAVSVRLRDGWLVGGTSKADVLDVQRNGSTLPLGSVALRQNYVSWFSSATFAATMSATTAVVDGVEVTQVTVTVGARTSGSTRTVSRSSTMLWTPSGAVTDLAGRPGSVTPATESGPADREF